MREYTDEELAQLLDKDIFPVTFLPFVIIGFPALGDRLCSREVSFGDA